ncbi:MAG TPA: response regulator transcription factor [Chitinophagaceae bacterium]
MPTVAFAEDHALIRDVIADLIETYEGFHVIARASDGHDLLEQIKNTGAPDILLLDLAMPGMAGYETALWMKEYYPATKILVLSTHSSDTATVRLLKAGVQGFLTKNIHPADLQKALREVMTTQSFFLQTGSERMTTITKQFITEGDFKKMTLNDRELEFMKRCCSDATYKEIADQMHVSPRTISHLIDSIAEKIGIKTRPGFVMYAVNGGLTHL